MQRASARTAFALALCMDWYIWYKKTASQLASQKDRLIGKTDRTGQDRAGQDKTGQDRTGQDRKADRETDRQTDR